MADDTGRGPVCCGEARATPFCPQCGAALEPANPLVSLHRYVETNAQGYAKKARGKFAKNVRRYRQTAEKWRAWADALRAVLDPGEEAKP